jgi:hypothetical protein
VATPAAVVIGFHSDLDQSNGESKGTEQEFKVSLTCQKKINTITACTMGEVSEV